MELVRGRVLERLERARRPADHRPVDAPRGPESEMEPAIVLAGEPHAPVYHLELPSRGRFERDLRADRAPVRARAHELERNPVVARHDGVLRSEEHTSELQSQSNLVCRLLL